MENAKQSIAGLSGIGKTSLAIEYARKYKEEYDFIAFFDAGSIITEFRSLAQALGVLLETIKEASERDISNFVYQKIYEKYNKVLLIFDDSSDMDDIKNFELLQQYETKIHWLITTKNQHYSKKIISIKVEVFTQEEAREYIKNRLLEIKVDDSSVSELTEELGRLPCDGYINKDKFIFCFYKLKNKFFRVLQQDSRKTTLFFKIQ